MSTRAVIAIPHPTRKWQGVYHRTDGYSAGLGAELDKLFEERGYEECAKLVTEHPAGWLCLLEYDSQFIDGGHQYPECYCHTPKWESNSKDDMTTYGDDPKYQEYLYLITPKGIEAYDTHKGRMIKLAKSVIRVPKRQEYEPRNIASGIS